jgi:hypothetical protein
MLNSFFQFLKELYLAEFVSFFKANNKWASAGWSAGSGVAGVSLFVCINLVAIGRDTYGIAPPQSS